MVKKLKKKDKNPFPPPPQKKKNLSQTIRTLPSLPFLSLQLHPPFPSFPSPPTLVVVERLKNIFSFFDKPSTNLAGPENEHAKVGSASRHQLEVNLSRTTRVNRRVQVTANHLREGFIKIIQKLQRESIIHRIPTALNA